MNPNAAMVYRHDTLLVVLSIFMPHRYFCLWTPGLGYLSVTVDALILLAYFSIPIALIYFVRNRKDITFAWMLVCLGIFVLASGATYLMEISNLRHPNYWLSNAIKVIVALASVPTAILLARLVPATQALRASEERMRAVLESALDCIVTVDHHGRVVEFNPAAEKTFGYKRDATIGQLIADLIIPPAFRDRHWRGLAHYLSTGESTLLGTRTELTGMRSDHSEFPVELAITRIGSHEPPMFTGFMRDITERKQAEVALAEQAIRYKTLMETSADSIYVLNERGDLQEANAAFLRRRGYTAAETKGLNVADWDAQWTGEQLQELLQEKLHSADEGSVFETRHRCKDGSVFDVEVSATRVRIGGEQLFFCVTRDITERKQAESALRQLAQVSAVSSDYIALIGHDFRYQFVNDTYLKARGLQLEDMIGHHMKEIVGQERFEQLGRPQVEACLRCEEVESFEWTDFRPDLRCFLHVKVAPLREPDGTVSGAVMSGRDITARDEAEQAHRESEERFRELAENISEVFFVWDATEGASRLLYVSPAYATIWGRSCESLYSSHQSWKDALHPDDKKWVLAELSGSDLEKINDLTYRIVRPGQSVRWIRDRIFPVHDENGVVVRLAEITVDITENKLAEEELRQVNKQLRVLSRRLFQVQDDERRHLARELHDEIGQALTAAKINVDSIESAEGGTQSLCLKETSTLLDNLLRQVRQISLDLHSSLLDDLGLAPALRSLLDQQARRAGLCARFDAVEPLEDIDPEIQTTGFRIAQEAITNVLRHAKAQSVGVHLQTEAGLLQLKIVDDGNGFDLAEVERRAYQGASFGLMGMRERAALVGGRVQIIASPNKGTTIQVSLPLHAPDERPRSAAP